MYETEITNLQRKLKDYVKNMEDTSRGRQGTVVETLDRPDLAIKTENGYPVMPPVSDGIDQKKKELEELIRRYLAAHYCGSYSCNCK